MTPATRSDRVYHAALAGSLLLLGGLLVWRPLAGWLDFWAHAAVGRTSAFVRASRRFGHVAQWRHPLAVFARDLMMRLTPESAFVAQARRILAS